MSCLLALAHILGFICEFLLIPRVIGEVSAGLVLGPTLFGYFYPEAFNWMFLGFPTEGKMFGFIYQIGLIMLMFCSGLKFHTTFEKNDGKITTAIVIGSTFIPFVIGWIATSMFNIVPYLGPAQNTFALKIVIAISIAVTSIPVISKIFNDLGIMHSRFAKLIIAIAGIHDILLWVALGIATSIAGLGSPVTAGTVIKGLVTTGLFIFGTLLITIILFKRLTTIKQNLLFRASNLGYFLFVVFILAVIAGKLNVESIFGALLAGIAAKLSLPNTVSDRIEQSISNISFSWFIPIYFATVGLQLDLAKHFNLVFFLKYLLFATIAQTVIVYMTSRLIKLDELTSLNFGIVMNARGGPGIVLSTVAYAAGIINQEFFAILVMLALITSWFAGSWLKFVLNRGWRLMPGDEGLVPERKADEFENIKGMYKNDY